MAPEAENERRFDSLGDLKIHLFNLAGSGDRRRAPIGRETG